MSTRRRCFRFFSLSLVLLSALAEPALSAEESDEAQPDSMVPVGFVIIKATTSYPEAARFLQEASAKSGIPIDLRGVVLDPNFGLTFSKEKFQEWQDPMYSYPWYFARGRYDDGVYLSIERSDSYESFTPGFFVVIAASGPPDSPVLTDTLSKLKTSYPTAYTKVAQVYHGCMH